MKNKKIIFWNVDTQKDFMNSDGALYVEGAGNIKPNLKKLTEFAKYNNITVVNTKDYHHFSDSELSDKPDFINTFPNHCIAGSIGEEFIDETQPKDYPNNLYYTNKLPTLNLFARNITIYKNKFDVFTGNPNTNKLLDFINPDIVVVYGVATNVCVNCAVLGLTKRGIEVIVVKDAIKELPNIPVTEIYEKWDERKVGWIQTDILVNDLQTLFDTKVLK